MRTVYAVEHGEYSDRSTECLFETRDLAEQYIEARIEGAKRYYADVLGWTGDYYGGMRWEIVEYQLWDSVPVVTGLDGEPHG